MERKPRFVPLVRHRAARTSIAATLLVASVVSAQVALLTEKPALTGVIIALSWMTAVLLTDKYTHKYPQRYFSYVLASHLKAGIIIACLALGAGAAFSVPLAPLFFAMIAFMVSDLIVSIPYRRDSDAHPWSVADLFPDARTSSEKVEPVEPWASINREEILTVARATIPSTAVELLAEKLPGSSAGASQVAVLDDLPATADDATQSDNALVIGRVRINDVRRLNRFLDYCTGRLMMGGFIILRYTPLEIATADLRRRYPGPLFWLVFGLHFVWYRALPKIPQLDALYFSSALSWLDPWVLKFVKRRNRVLSKAEVWGRLAYCGLNVVQESPHENEVYLLAQRVAPPQPNKRPSYYPVVALEKVGLDGRVLRMHKFRTMFPFSEFLQKRVFEEHGLAPGGKFANDFRLTGLGKLLRRYWLDELPQVIDWLRGDLKLVGIRATSRHFLSLYKHDFLELYLQTKPGLVPPIFDSATASFSQIEDIEMTYLRRHQERPLRTDAEYLLRTFTDIVFRGIRSR